MTATTGLVRYEAKCAAIAECYTVDEAKDIRDKARAIEVYARQARNMDAERKASEIRLRAERRAGQLLREMKQSGERHDEKGSNRKVSDGATPKPTLADLGITRDQSSQWQELATVPDEDFEREVTNANGKPSTEGIILAQRMRAPAPAVDPDAIWLWGRLKDFERWRFEGRSIAELLDAMTSPMRQDTIRLGPMVAAWLLKARE